MYKKFLIGLLIAFFLFIPLKDVKALNNNEIIVHKLAGDDECEAVFGDPNDKESVAYFLEQILVIMQYAAPILCIVLSIMDFAKAAASQDKDNLSKAMKTTGKRIIFAMIVFFVPLLVDFLFPLIGFYGTCGIG